jgi:hypothetical protein
VIVAVIIRILRVEDGLVIGEEALPKIRDGSENSTHILCIFWDSSSFSQT